jgi:SAM-dependent methyltransferase
MKLSELIAFRNQLNELSVDDAKTAAAMKLDILMHKIEFPSNESLSELTTEFVPVLQDLQSKIYDSFTNFNSTVDQVRQRVRDQISEKEKYWFQESYQLFELAELCETTDNVLHGRKYVGEKSEKTIESELTLQSRLSNYADWRWPGMIIRPGLENFVEHMVGCDPLYVVDRTHDLLQPCLARFPKTYQHRLRTYITNDWSDKPLLERIPENQFGVCLAYNVFNFRPLEIIRQYLEEIYQKLRPGGVLLMTYNDCDRAPAVMLVEQFCASYTPGYLIRDLAQNVGFEQKHTWSDGGPSVWLELVKPGELVSLRGGQAMAEIKWINEIQNDIDFLRRKPYTKEEIRQLQNHARELEINEKVIKRSTPFELHTAIQETVAEKYRQQEIKRIENLKNTARSYNVDTDSDNWQTLLNIAIQKQQELLKKEKELLKKQEEEKETKRIAELHESAKSFGIDPTTCPNEQEIRRLIAEAIDASKKAELLKLRQRAMELEAGNPNLIKYGYSAEKLKQLINEKENK